MERHPFAMRIEQVESAGDPNAVSPKGAIGSMQVMPATLRQPGFGLTPLAEEFWDDPEMLRDFGDSYLGKMLERYEGNEEYAAVAYNAGPGVADKYREGVLAREDLPEETQGYLAKLGLVSGAQAATVEDELDPSDIGAAAQEVLAEEIEYSSEDISAAMQDLNIGQPEYTEEDFEAALDDVYSLDNIVENHSDFLDIYRKYWMQAPEVSLEDAADDYIDTMRWFDANSVGAFNTMRQVIGSEDGIKKAAFGRMLLHWDNVPASLEGVGGSLWRAALDPVNLASLGVGGLAAKAGTSALKAAIISAMVDAGGSVAHDAFQQEAAIGADVQEEYNPVQGAVSGAVGGTLSFAPTAIGVGVGKMLQPNGKEAVENLTPAQLVKKELDAATEPEFTDRLVEVTADIVGEDRVNSINFRRLAASEDAGKFIREEVEDMTPMPSYTLDEIDTKAKELGIDKLTKEAEDYLNQGVALTGAQATNLRYRMVAAAENFKDLSAALLEQRKVDPDGLSLRTAELEAARNMNLFAFRKLSALDQKSANLASQLMNSYRIVADSPTARQMVLMDLNNITVGEIDDIAGKVARGEMGVADASKKIDNNAMERIGNAFGEIFYNGLLGAFDTGAVNFFGSLYNNVSKNIIEAYLSGGIGKLRGDKATYSMAEAKGRASAFGADPAEWKSLFSNPNSSKFVKGMGSGTYSEALKVAWQYFKSDRPLEALGAQITAKEKELASAPAGAVSKRLSEEIEELKRLQTVASAAGESDLRRESVRMSIPGLPGYIVRFPGRVMSSTDAFNKILARHGALRGLASRQAVEEGMKPGTRAFNEYVSSLVLNPSAQMKKAVYEEMLDTTFQSRNKFTNFILEAQKMPYGVGPAVRTVIPFANTPANLVKWGLERVPGLAPLVSKNIPKEELYARQIHGGALIALGWLAVESGQMTGGGPTDLDERLFMQQGGWEPYQNIETGLGISRLDPLAWPMQFGAALNDSMKRIEGLPPEQKQKATDYLMALTDEVINVFSVTVAERTYLESLSRFMGMFGDKSETQGIMDGIHQHLASTIAAGVPGYLNRLGQATDENARRSSGIMEKVMHRLPWARENLATRADAFGEPIKEKPGVPFDFVAIFRQAVEPKHKHLFDMGVEMNASLLRSPKNVAGVELTSKEREYIEYLQGQYAVQVFESAYENFKHMSDEVKEANSGLIKKFFAETFSGGQKVAIEALKSNMISNPEFPLYDPQRAREFGKAEVEKIKSQQKDPFYGRFHSNYPFGSRED